MSVLLKFVKVDMDKLSLKERLDNLPHKPGVYYLKDRNNKIIYIGKAKSLKNRVRSYFQNSVPFDPKTAVMLSKIKILKALLPILRLKP